MELICQYIIYRSKTVKPSEATASNFDLMVKEQVVTPSVVVTLGSSGVTPVTPTALDFPLFHETLILDPPLEHENTYDVTKIYSNTFS